MSKMGYVHYAVGAIGLMVALSFAEGKGPIAPAASLRDVGEFDAIKNPVERSKALFVEIGRVIQHPRCLNCHPTDAHPRQGDLLAIHQPLVVRGDANHGTAAMYCSTCHQLENIDHARLPGNPVWHLAPVEMGWIGKSLSSICGQIKDKERNGGRNLKALHDHMAHDSLAGWAWMPGPGREPAPGTQASFGRLFSAWIESGAHCPDGEDGAATGPEAPMGADCSNCH